MERKRRNLQSLRVRHKLNKLPEKKIRKSSKMKMPSRHLANEHFANSLLSTSARIGQYWVPARPEPFYYGFPRSIWERFRLAWAVFCGKADALFWMNNQ